MSARLLLNVMEGWLVDVHGEDAVYDMLNPPTAEEKRAAHLAEIAALGIRTEVM